MENTKRFTGFVNQPEGGCEGAINIAKLLGPAAWKRLPQAVQRRFLHPVVTGQQVVYRGVMEKVEASFVGHIIAWLALVVGAPIARKTGRNIACDVVLYHDEKRGGTVWERNYFFGNRKLCARTTKKAASDGASLECFGAGCGMVLDIFEQERALHFVSTRFFIEIFGVRINLPKIFQPGRLEVIHKDIGNGAFNFSMRLDHPQLGEILFQDGVFHDPGPEFGKENSYVERI